MKLVSIFFKATTRNKRCLRRREAYLPKGVRHSRPKVDIRAKRKFQSKSIHNDSKATSKILLKTIVQITGKRTPGKLEEQAF